MSTRIEWADDTWSVVVGCERVSAGCDGCYAIRFAHRHAHNPHPGVADTYAGLTEHRDGRLDWTGVVRTVPGRLDKPLRWRKPRRIFVCSQADLFHADAPAEFIAHVFAVMAATPRHTYLVLTKRPWRMRSLLTRPTFPDEVAEHATDLLASQPWKRWQVDTTGWRAEETAAGNVWHPRWPLPNVHVGVSAEDQQRAHLRIPHLLDTPAAVRWVSAEPLLGPLDLGEWLPTADRPGLGWVVVGGEDGPTARPMHPAWARTVRDQCQAAEVPFTFKQWGAWGPTGRVGLGTIDGGRSRIVGPPLDEYGQGEEVARLGKNTTGRLLDGQLWDEYPPVVAP